MATLTDAFLADLDDLSDDAEEAKLEDKKDIEDAERAADLASAQVDDVAAIAPLTSTERFTRTLADVDAEVARHGDELPEGWAGPSEADPLYRLIVACNELAMAVDDEIAKVHAFIQEKYRPRFPELEGLVLDSLAYARVVARIGNEENVIDIELEDVIPRHVVMTVSVSASTTDGRPLPEAALQRVLEACAMAEALDAARAKLTRFVGSRMGLVAPNLSAVCGAEVAAKLVGAAGGLARLSEIPACNIQVMGQRRRINAGLSSRSAGANQGYVFSCPLVQNTPPDYRRKAAKLVANKVALLARYDAFGTRERRQGEQGAEMRKTMEATVEKWLEPPPAPTAKPLPVPDAQARKRRGGKRWRKQKERVAATEMMKLANRMQFGTAEEEYVDGDEMYGLGMLGKDGHGKLKMMQAASKISKKEKQMTKAQQQAAAAAGGGGVSVGRGGTGTATAGKGGGLISGTQSSLAFSAVQGIELENPDRERDAGAGVGGTRTSGTESYFSELSGFQSYRKIT